MTQKFRAWDDINKKWLLGYEYPRLGGFSMMGETMLFGEYNQMLSSFKLENWDKLILTQSIGQFDETRTEDYPNGREMYDGDIVTFRDFRGVHTTKQSVHDGYINGWIGVIRWNKHDGWCIDKKNEHNKEMLKKKGNEKESRNFPYIYRMDGISGAHPVVIGNIFENPELIQK